MTSRGENHGGHERVDPDHAADLQGEELAGRQKIGLMALTGTVFGILVLLAIFWLIVVWVR